MNNATDSTRPLHNRILSSLPKAEYERLLPHLEYVELPLGEVLFEPEDPIRHVYFPFRGTISLTCVMEDGSEVEVGVVGREGMLGLPIVLGTNTVPLKALVQIPNGSMRMKVEAFREAIDSGGGALYKTLLRYAQAFFMQTAQTAACNRLHRMEGRLARWLLMSQDRTQSDKLQLTQEFIAIMLGVRRAGVTTAAGRLKDAGLINYTRGTVQILDRRGLEALSCDCYRIVKKEFDRLHA